VTRHTSHGGMAVMAKKSETAKIIKRWYHSASHWHLGDIIIFAVFSALYQHSERNTHGTGLMPTPSVCCITFAESEPYCHSGMFVWMSVGHATAAGRASGRCCCCAAARSRQVDSGSRQTLLVLQFTIEFANIWAQYSPSTYASTHVGFFWICGLTSKWQPFNA